jgi:ABC-type dipeptide/oligopeptide/nickel transport system ATPase component
MALPQFKKATKLQARARVALIGLSGGGKTYTALALATERARSRD